MIEKTPGNEQNERREWLVTNLKERGLNDPEVKKTLEEWTMGLESMRAPDHSPEALDPSDIGSGTAHTIVLAMLFKEAGLIPEALDLLEIARMDAHNMGNDERRKEIEDVMDSLEDKL